MVQWLELRASTAVAGVPPLVGELRSHKPQGVAKKKKKPIVSLNAHQKGAKRRHVPGYEAKQAYTIYWTHKMFC